MKKAKKVFWSMVVILVVLVIAAVVIVSAFLGNIAKKGIETLGPKITKVSIKVDAVQLSLLTGSASIKGLIVGNPQGYQTPQAIHAGLIAIGINPLSVLSDKIVLRSLQLESPEITFEGSLRGNNLSQILDNVNGSAQAAAQNGGAVSTGTNAPAKPSKKYEVDDLLITGAKVHVLLTDWGGKEMTLSLPPIHLTDLGKNPEGITVADLSRSVLDAIVTATVKAVADTSTHLGKNAEQLIIHTDKNAAVSNVARGLNNLLGK
jgi:AsmA family